MTRNHPSHPSTPKLRNLMLLCTIPLLLTACLSIKSNPTASSNPSIYDFGISTVSPSLESAVAISSITASEALNSNRIRYRLNYKDPGQVLTYSESRWSMPPARLFEQQLLGSTQINAANPSTCLLSIQLVTFDHVFNTPQESAGVVQANVAIIDKRSHKTLANTALQASYPATSSDAKGGVNALKQATQATIRQTITWANAQQAATLCNP